MRFPSCIFPSNMLYIGVLIALLIYTESKCAQWTWARTEVIIRKMQTKLKLNGFLEDLLSSIYDQLLQTFHHVHSIHSSP